MLGLIHINTDTVGIKQIKVSSKVYFTLLLRYRMKNIMKKIA